MKQNKTLTEQKVKAIRQILCNDEASTDQELKEHFINEIGVSEETAMAYIRNRTSYLNEPELLTAPIELPQG